jgi:Icc-related predicted phosphoesterase
MSKQSLVVYGDPHGDYRPLYDECSKRHTDAVLIVGDMTGDPAKGEEVRPIADDLRPLIEEGIKVLWIPGNHDANSVKQFRATFESLPEANLHGRVETILGGLRVAGLGGVFRGKVWFPRYNYEQPSRYDTHEALAADTPREDRWRGGIPTRHYASIFKSDAEAIRKQGADILITHEGLSSIRHGFAGLDDLANDMDVKVVFHGHHHESYEAELMTGIKVRGVGKREAVRIDL